MSLRNLRLSLSAACLLTLAGTALGQNALGGGRALDGGLSTQPGGRVNASPQDLQSIVRYNTYGGNALNGPSYLGRPAMGSSRAYPGTIGDAISRGLVRDAGLLSRYAPNQRYDAQSYTSPIRGADRVAAIESGYLPQGSLTSTVSLPQGARASDYSRANDPNVGFTRDQRGDFFIARGSPLRGLYVEPVAQRGSMLDSPSDEPKTGTAATYGRVIDELRRASLSRALGAPSDAARPEAKPATDTPAAAPTTPAPGTPVQYDPNAALRRLRERLAANKPKEPAKPAPTDPARKPTPTTPDPSNTPATVALTDDDVAALRNMGLKLDTLVPPGATDAQASDGYTRLGQEALAAGRFGLADQMFQAARTRNPGNVMARAGGIHATMGLGLLMSAGADLRQLFVEHPEMIPIRFNDTLLVPRARADRLADMLKADIDRAGGALLPDSGLTLAYLGRQFDNPAWLSKGLGAMLTQTKDDPQGTELHVILDRVWNNPVPPITEPGVPAPARPTPAGPTRSVEPSK